LYAIGFPLSDRGKASAGTTDYGVQNKKISALFSLGEPCHLRR
jgi:hypothetical protein